MLIRSPLPLCSLGLEPWTLPSDSFFQEVARHFCASGKHRQPRYWSSAWKREPWIRRLYTLMYAHSTPDDFADLLISLLADSPVPRRLLPVSALGSKASLDSGTRCAESSESVSQRSSSSKTFPASTPSRPALPAFATLMDSQWTTIQTNLFVAREPFYATWPASGSMRSGTCYRRSILVIPSFASGSSSSPGTPDVWPTPQAHDQSGPRGEGNYLNDHDHKPHDLSMATEKWRTPDVPASGGPRNRQNSVGHGHQTTIGEQAEHWQTPATDSFRSRGGERRNEQGLDQQARTWKSPQARDYRSGESPRTNREMYGTRAEPLSAQVREFGLTGPPDPETPTSGQPSSSAGPTSRLLWPTPDQNMDRGSRESHITKDPKAGGDLTTASQTWASPRTSERGSYTRDSANPDAERPSLTGQAVQSRSTSKARKKLNPMFVEWLQGVPIGWTSLTSLEPTAFELWAERSSSLVRAWLSLYSRSGQESERSTTTEGFD